MIDWTKRIAKAEKFLEPCTEHGRKVYSRYKDSRDEVASLAQRANFFFANVNTLKESLFNSMPKPDVQRVQRGDFQDDPSRVAANVVARGLTYEIECAKDFDEAISLAIIDRLVPGIGQVWVSFKAETQEDELGGQKVVEGSEEITVEHVYWEDFIYEPCRRWSKCGWVGRRLHLTRGEMKKAYGEDAVDKAGMASGDDDSLTAVEINKDKFCVYEVWDKRSKKVYHVVKGLDEPLKTLDDPYQLRGFFPCPRPLVANADTTGFKPVTDYHLAQDQYNQLDVLYGRIQLIIEAMKVVGLYDASNTDIGRMLQGAENRLIPVDNWAMHAERGGTRGQIDWFPVEQVATVLQALYAAFEATKSILFEITGMSDIIRGASNPYETKGAQEIKAQFASVRMGAYQRDVAKFVRDILRIMAEMFTQLYSDTKVMQIIGDLPPADQQHLPAAAQILRSDVLSKYKVNIQTNSLTQADWALEKEQRMELVTTIGQMVGQITQMSQQVPGLEMLGVQLIKFAIAGYKAGTELEGWIDQQLDEMSTKAMEAKNNPQPPEPSPEEKKAQAETEKMQMEMQIKQQEAQMNMGLEQQKMQMDLQMKQAELAHKEKMAQMDMQIKQIELQMKQMEAQLNMQIKQQEAGLNMQVKQAEAAMGLEQKQAAGEQQMELAKQKAAQQPKEPKK